MQINSNSSQVALLYAPGSKPKSKPNDTRRNLYILNLPNTLTQ